MRGITGAECAALRGALYLATAHIPSFRGDGMVMTTRHDVVPYLQQLIKYAEAGRLMINEFVPPKTAKRIGFDT